MHLGIGAQDVVLWAIMVYRHQGTGAHDAVLCGVSTEMVYSIMQNLMILTPLSPNCLFYTVV